MCFNVSNKKVTDAKYALRKYRFVLSAYRIVGPGIFGPHLASANVHGSLQLGLREINDELIDLHWTDWPLYMYMYYINNNTLNSHTLQKFKVIIFNSAEVC